MEEREKSNPKGKNQAPEAPDNPATSESLESHEVKEEFGLSGTT